ncbi:hypothetical protein Slin15195_G025420 [Septoria linicola]|uniref:Secreted protein n=1 Tax=Septoria linicola TaxID=215465 RepID=A0A9Q9ALL3_9PEZI|nr:hypothetical protein Slin14017_G024500 [Septoria linicola]USW49223.1 hypothetical protein Slin15195_G025420 [Septoria linicola]
MAFRSTVLALLACVGISTASQIGGSNVTILELGKGKNSTGGEGFVAAGGKLRPFGDIGVACGVNWQDGVAYGGGLDAGSADFGLGGGWKITPDTMSIGAGIGINGANSSANVNFQGSKNGTFELRFESSSSFACVPSNEDGKFSVVCSTVQ